MVDVGLDELSWDSAVEVESFSEVATEEASLVEVLDIG